MSTAPLCIRFALAVVSFTNPLKIKLIHWSILAGTTQAAPQNNYGGYPHSRQASLYRGYQSNQGYQANQGYPSGQESSYPSAQGADYQEAAQGNSFIS